MQFAQFYFSVEDIEIYISAATEQSAIYLSVREKWKNH